MSNPSGGSGDPWVQPGDPTRPVPSPPPPPSDRPYDGYGTPSSPSYGRYGQGEAQPTVPQPTGSPTGSYGSLSDQLVREEPAPGPPQWGQQQWGQQQWGQQQWGRPEYVTQQPWPNGVGVFRACGGLGVAVIVLSVLLTVVTWIIALLSPDADRKYEAALDEGRPVADVLTAYDMVGLLSVPVTIGAWALTCVWLGRARENALLLNPGGQRRSAVWVWLSWLTPFVSLWFPKQILDDTIKATAPAAGVRPTSTGWYWAAWIAMNLFTNVQLRLSLNAAPEDAVTPGLEFAIAIATTVALALWIPLVRRVSAIQDQLAANGVVRR